MTIDTLLHSAPSDLDASGVHTITSEAFSVHRFSKDIDVASVTEFEATLRRAGARGSTIVLDLTKVGFLGVSGLEVLWRFCEDAKHAGARVVIAGGPAVERPLRMAGITVPVHVSVDAACTDSMARQA